MFTNHFQSLVTSIQNAVGNREDAFVIACSIVAQQPLMVVSPSEQNKFASSLAQSFGSSHGVKLYDNVDSHAKAIEVFSALAHDSAQVLQIARFTNRSVTALATLDRFGASVHLDVTGNVASHGISLSTLTGMREHAANLSTAPEMYASAVAWRSENGLSVRAAIAMIALARVAAAARGSRTVELEDLNAVCQAVARHRR